MVDESAADWGLSRFPEHTRSLRRTERLVLQNVIRLKELEGRLPEPASSEIKTIVKELFQNLDNLHNAIGLLEGTAEPRS